MSSSLPSSRPSSDSGERRLAATLSGLKATARSIADCYHGEFLRFSWRRAVIAGALVAIYSLASQPLAARYYARHAMPVDFRNMDMTASFQVMREYIDAHEPGPDMLLVLGDCVTYGQGTVHGFSDYLELPGLTALNVGMYSFRPTLMLLTIDYAASRGVKNFLVQLHPFNDYVQYSEEARLAGFAPVTAETAAGELAAEVRGRWRVETVEMTLRRPASAIAEVTRPALLQLSTLLRQDLFARFPLYRNRFALDDGYGLRTSFFSYMSQRADTYVTPLDESRQEQIYTEPNMDAFWQRFVIGDRDSYRDLLAAYSPQARIARYAQDRGINVVFVLSPADIPRVEAYTPITADDLRYASETSREIVTRYGAPYLDYLADPALEAQMYHFDNVTAEGQRLIGEKLTRDLASLLPHLQEEVAAR